MVNTNLSTNENDWHDYSITTSDGRTWISADYVAGDMRAMREEQKRTIDLLFATLKKMETSKR